MTPPLEESSPSIEVDPLGAPTEPPWGQEEATPGDTGEELEAPAPATLSDQDVARRLVVILAAPFAVAATVRGPHWMVSQQEIYPVAENLALVIPRTWWVERALEVSPWGAAGMELLSLVRARLAIDEQLRAQKEDTAGGETDPGAGATAPRPARPDRAPGVASTRDESQARASADGWEGAGLGPELVGADRQRRAR